MTQADGQLHSLQPCSLHSTEQANALHDTFLRFEQSFKHCCLLLCSHVHTAHSNYQGEAAGIELSVYKQ